LSSVHPILQYSIMHMLVLSISNTRTKFEKFSFTHSKDMTPNSDKKLSYCIWVSYSYWSLDDLVVSREVPCLDGLSRCSRKNKAIKKWGFQPLPRPVSFTLDLLYESGSPTPLKGCVVRGAVHPRCSRPSPVRFTAHCTDTHSPHREEVGLMD